MEQVIRQLESVRRIGRLLLISQRLMVWVSAFIVLLMAGGLSDYALRLPSWVRIVIATAAAAGLAIWLIGQLRSAISFSPGLSALAMRAERLYPALAGTLASSVEFAARPEDFADPQRTAALADATVRRVRQVLDEAPLRRLIEPAPTLRVAGALLGVLVIGASVFAAAPDHSRLALQRWFNPLGGAQWPKRTSVQSMVDAAIWPIDTPLPLEAQVTRGYRSGMRAWVVYRLIDADGRSGAAHRQLMTEQFEGDAQREGVMSRQIDVPAEADAPDLNRSADAAGWSAVRFYFEAGDDQTVAQTVSLIERPAVRMVNVSIDPPTYVRGLVQPQRVELSASRVAGPIATSPPALIGSQVRFTFELNDAAIDAPAMASNWPAVLPGFAMLPAAAVRFDDDARRIEAQFTVSEPVESRLHVTDRHGYSNSDDRLYRIDAIEDRPPAVSMVLPARDEAVLASAVIDLEAVGRDDVGVEQLALAADVVRTGPAPAPAPGSGDGEEPVDVVRLNESAGRRAEMGVRDELDLLPLRLRPGDEVVVTASAIDVFELDGLRHDAVRSSPRTLQIIDQSTLISQLRTEMAALRRQAVRLESKQRQIMQMTPGLAEGRQASMNRRLEAQHAIVKAMQSRIARNRLAGEHAEPLDELLNAAGEHLGEAERASQRAAQKLKEAVSRPDRARQASKEARSQQQQVSRALSQLADLLDQGGDAEELQLQIEQLLTRQTHVAEDTRSMMPQTLGQPVDQLDPADARRLAELARRQQGLAQKADGLVGQMASSAEALSRQSKDVADQATAAAMQAAVAVAQRRGLQPAMKNAGKMAGENRLSAASNQQAEAIDALEQMLDELKDRQRRRHEMLKRSLMKLAEAIRKLITQSEAQLARLGGDNAPPVLAAPMQKLWTNTLAVQEQADQTRQTKPAGELISQAAAHQADAVKALRNDDAPAAENAEAAALAKLKEALELIESQRDQLNRDDNEAKRKKLRKQYLDLTAQQIALRERTAPLMNIARPSRRDRPKLAAMGQEQTAIRQRAAALREQVEKTIVFEQLHEWIDATAEQVAATLTAGRTDALLPADQQQIAAMLNQMEEALKRQPEDEPFAGDENNGGGQGGTGGGGPLVPDLAELKLLRGMQALIHLYTRQLHERHADAPVSPDSLDRQLQQLAGRQRELAGTGERLISKLKQKLPPPDQGNERITP